MKDASIADGATTTGICVGCMRSNCEEQVRACAINCQCQGIMGDAIECYFTTQNLACAGRLTDYLVRQETRAAALTMLGCARTSWTEECALEAGAPPPSDAASDGAVDAAAGD